MIQVISGGRTPSLRSSGEMSATVRLGVVMRSGLAGVIALAGVGLFLGGCGEQPPADGTAAVTAAQPSVGLAPLAYDGPFRAVGMLWRTAIMVHSSASA